MAIAEQISLINKQLNDSNARLIVVTKTRSIEELQETYAAGAIEFGENRVQEMVEKQAVLPKDILWHQIGHLQTNKVKYIAPFVHLIHSVDSLNLLKEINKQAAKNERVIDCLLQIYIATEESKFGLDFAEAEALLEDPAFAELRHIRIVGLMGMASFTADEKQIRQEFQSLADFFQKLKNNKTGVSTGLVEWIELSMGMSGDYLIAAELGATLVRVGSAIYGPRH
ncbi:MAG: YggS family pyridoxal phosphate-dependent enzyme [Aquirufa sp.]|jgi:pyridoxal phosphate enzyme (YggS family)